MSVKDKTDYKALGSKFGPKEEWHRSWAKEECDRLYTERTKIEQWSHADECVGTYMPLKKIMEAEGEDAAGIQAAKLYCLRCVLMRGRWIRWNKMTSRHDFLYVRSGFREVYSKTWETRTVRRTESKQNAAPAADAELPAPAAHAALPAEPADPTSKKEAPVDAPVETSPKGRKPGANPGAKPKAKAAPKGSGLKRGQSFSLGTQKKGKKSPAADQLANATDAEEVRSQHASALGRALQQVATIENDSEWMWAKTEVTCGALKASHEKCEKTAKACGSIVGDFLCGCNTLALLERHGEKAVKDALQKVLDVVQPVVDDLTKQMANISEAHMIMRLVCQKESE